MLMNPTDSIPSNSFECLEKHVMPPVFFPDNVEEQFKVDLKSEATAFFQQWQGDHPRDAVKRKQGDEDSTSRKRREVDSTSRNGALYFMLYRTY